MTTATCACGGPPGDAEAFICAECGRPLGTCADPGCGWLVRLFDSGDPADCDGCGWFEKNPEDDARLLAANGPCPGCGGPRTSPERHCLGCSVGRIIDNQKQMQERSGPLYELSRERGRIMSAAWRAAGSPARLIVIGGWRPGETRWYLYAPWKRERRNVGATVEQVTAWQAWLRERSRLRRALGWDR